MSESVPQTAPGRTYAQHREEYDAAVAGVLRSGTYILGDEVRAFEIEFAEWLGARYAIGVGSGTDAIELALRALGVGSGSAVFTVSHTAVATIAAIERSGAVPILLDVDPATFTMDPERLQAAINETVLPAGIRQHAVVPVHLYGQMADMPAILEIARTAGLFVVEDCAQAHGARLHGRPAGTWGDAAGFSYYPTKNLAAFGDGGMVITADASVADRVRSLHQYGWAGDRVSAQPGFNSRLDELQAAILRVGLRHLRTENQRRAAIAARYDALRSGPIQIPFVAGGAEHAYHQYVIRTTERDAFRHALDGAGIRTAVHYPIPVHLQPAYESRVPLGGSLTHTELASSQVVSLPMFPWLSEPEIERVCAAISTWAVARPSRSSAG